MSAERNAQAVIYEAFGKGDVPAILEKLSHEVAWEQWRENHAQRDGVPHLLERHGHDGGRGVLQLVGQMDIHDFKVSS